MCSNGKGYGEGGEGGAPHSLSLLGVVWYKLFGSFVFSCRIVLRRIVLVVSCCVVLVCVGSSYRAASYCPFLFCDSCVVVPCAVLSRVSVCVRCPNHQIHVLQQ